MTFIYNNFEVTINDETVNLTNPTNRVETQDYRFDHFGAEASDSKEDVADLVKEWLDEREQNEAETLGK